MANPVIADAIGVVDGVNKDFTTPTDYQSGTLEVFINGLLVRQQDLDGWIETGPNSFRLNEVPLPPDLIRVFYIDTLPLGPGAQIEKLVGCLVAVDELCGTMKAVDVLSGCLEEVDSLDGCMTTSDPFP